VRSLPDLRLETIFTQYFWFWSAGFWCAGFWCALGVHNLTLAKRPRASTLGSIVYESFIEEFVKIGACKTDLEETVVKLLVFSVLEVLFGTFIGELEGIFVFGVIIAGFTTF